VVRSASSTTWEQSQRDLGLAAQWADQIPGFLDSITLPG
jgi:hypothetical protein